MRIVVVGIATRLTCVVVGTVAVSAANVLLRRVVVIMAASHGGVIADKAAAGRQALGHGVSVNPRLVTRMRLASRFCLQQ